VQALAMGGKLAFLVGQSSPRGKVAVTVLPGEAALTVLLDTPFLVVVLRVVGAALAVQLALKPPLLTGIGSQFLAQGYKPRLPLAWDDSNGRGSKVQPDHVMSRLIFWLLLVGGARESQLHGVAVALAVRAFGTRTGRLTTHQPCVLDAVVQSIFDHRVIPVDNRGQTVLAPHQPPLVPLFGRLEHKA